MNDGRKKKPQKHQNKTAFKIQFDTLALQHQKKVSLSLLCKRCADQINWKLQFNKYKKITQPSKCNFCHQKLVVRSYMKSCDSCAEKQGVCPKCLSKDAEFVDGEDVKLSQKQQAEKDRQQQKALNAYVDSLKQRSRRKVRRQYEKGVITWDNQNKFFRDAEGNQVIGLKFKGKKLDDLQRSNQGNSEDDWESQGQQHEQQDEQHDQDDQAQKILQLQQKSKKNKTQGKNLEIQSKQKPKQQQNQKQKPQKPSKQSQTKKKPNSEEKQTNQHHENKNDSNKDNSSQQGQQNDQQKQGQEPQQQGQEQEQEQEQRQHSLKGNSSQQDQIDDRELQPEID